jgi:hypothetical protein
VQTIPSFTGTGFEAVRRGPVVNPQPKLLSICLFLVNRFADSEFWISIFQAFDELVCCKDLNLLFYF